MRSRTELDDILRNILTDLDLSANVYFQPPESLKMNYPCIVYEREVNHTEFADNSPYMSTCHYTVTVIDKNPDSKIPWEIAKLPMCTMSRPFISDNLNHFPFSIYY